ncbi:HPP family protein [Cocleimonas sp. KMM 6892]|uniref:HPP family protein n=1 Tax=unclassified Cocleimonas TaxID=2639732 RepID=UPI002DB92146|nr:MULTISPECIES: HPP family protein [unclassified Cocleimonas]MEB8433493.1 HPP family protein [Cocleimonas sp. KMM 6892]MEC4716304.1 HPP family protein [Cocleimonas sp. KMM 6895]MEC4745803.1 HPP family protein [Cocleimonas sp. KMM 6896]
MTKLKTIFGIAQSPVSHIEKIVSATGGFTAIFFIIIISQQMLSGDTSSAALIIASMGASAVLLFAVPHGPLSQPWPVIGGHLISALIGVSCAKLIPNELMAASLAVGIAIGAMYYLKCIHPPGGATALSAVIGGSATHELGYQFILTPILLNVVVILMVGILFNYPFAWRRYPFLLHRFSQQKQNQIETPSPDTEVIPSITHEDFVYALSEIDSFIDVSEYDLIRIYNLATKKSQQASFDPKKMIVGSYYSSATHGENWTVRQIVDESSPIIEGTKSADPDKDIVIYKVIEGKNKRSSGYSTRKEFLEWAKNQVEPDGKAWKILEHTPPL